MAAYPHVALANLYNRTRQADLALRSAQRATELGPDVAAAQRILGTLYFTQLRTGGGPDLAALAIAAFRESVRLEPGDIESRGNLARLLLASRKPDEAAEHLQAIVRFNPGAYYEMFLLAQVRRGQDDIPGAIRLLKQSLAVQPQQPEAREMLAELLQGEERFDEVADVYRGALEEAPSDLDARLRLADALANAGRLEEAEDEFGKILEEDPENVIGMVGLAMVEREQMNLASAEARLQEALELEPTHILARYTLASVYEQKREYEEAIAQWNELIEGSGAAGSDAERTAEYYAHIGFAHEQLSRFQESVDAYRKAYELSGEDERFETFYVQGLLTAKRNDEAIELIDSALAENPGRDRLRVLKARAVNEAGDHDTAVAVGIEEAAFDDFLRYPADTGFAGRFDADQVDPAALAFARDHRRHLDAAGPAQFAMVFEQRQ